MANDVLLLDDGELDDVQRILEKQRVGFARIRGGAIVANTAAPERLLIATPRRIEAVAEVQGEGDPPVRIVVVTGDSTTLRAKLREIGFDYLVRRPVHPEALRLLILHALYAGEERRTEPRVPVGFDVSVRTGLLPRRATLMDLSSKGCRVLARYRLAKGENVRIEIPKAMGISEALSLSGEVIRTSEEDGPDDMFGAAVVFRDLTSELRDELEWILEERARGPATLPRPVDGDPAPQPAEPPTGGASAGLLLERPVEEVTSSHRRVDPRSAGSTGGMLSVAPPDSTQAPDASSAGPEPAGASLAFEAEVDDGRDRRRHTRVSYERKVPAFGSEALQVLVGRDLSSRGMRVHPTPELSIGDRLHLAIYGDPREEPFMVWATVARNDSDRGVALLFEDLESELAAQLDAVVASLPAVESLHDDEVQAMGTVVTRIVEN